MKHLKIFEEFDDLSAEDLDGLFDLGFEDSWEYCEVKGVISGIDYILSKGEEIIKDFFPVPKELEGFVTSFHDYKEYERRGIPIVGVRITPTSFQFAIKIRDKNLIEKIKEYSSQGKHIYSGRYADLVCSTIISEKDKEMKFRAFDVRPMVSEVRSGGTRYISDSVPYYKEVVDLYGKPDPETLFTDNEMSPDKLVLDYYGASGKLLKTEELTT